MVITWMLGILTAATGLAATTFTKPPQDANAIIGAIVDVHKRGNGLFGCGELTEDGIIMVEAMKWMAENLNEDGGKFFLPNISLGVRVFDSCERIWTAAAHLAEFLPEIQGNNKTNPTTSILKLGMVDGAQLSDNPEIWNILQKFKIPAIPLKSYDVYVTANERSMAIASMMKQMQWNYVMIVHGSDEYSLNMLHTFIHLMAVDDDFCVTSVQQFISSQHMGDNETTRETFLKNEILFYSLQSAFESQIPVLVLMSFTEYHDFLKSFDDALTVNTFHKQKADQESERPLIFSDLLRHQELKMINHYNFDIYSIALLPDHVPAFEEYWKNRLLIIKNATSPNSIEDEWLVQYLHQFKLNTSEDDLHRALQTRAVLSSSYTILVFAQALEQVWKEMCLGSNGDYCSQIFKLDREIFLKRYFEPILLNSAVFNTSETQEEQKYHTFVLQHYQPANDSINLKKVMLFNPKSGLHMLDEQLIPQRKRICFQSNDSEQECQTCLQIRSDRADYGRRFSMERHRFQKPEIKKSDSLLPPSEKDYIILVKSPKNLYVALLIALHNETDSESLVHCKTNAPIDSSAVRQLEAFLWALKKVNNNIKRNLDENLQLGAVLLDTCSSRVRMMTLAAGIENFSNRASSQGSLKIIATVNVLNQPDGKVVDEILSSLNITSVSTSQSTAFVNSDLEVKPFILQVEPELTELATSVQKILENFGWTYVSVIYSLEKEEYSIMFRHFQKVAAESGICIALEQGFEPTKKEDVRSTKLSDLVIQLVESRAAGARAVLLLLSPDDLDLLMQAVGQALGHGTLKREDLFWLIVAVDNQAEIVLEKFGNFVGGALLFSSQNRPVREFLQHLWQIQLGSKKIENNPWLQKYIHQVTQCHEAKCKLGTEVGGNIDFNTVQAVLSIGTAYCDMYSQMCLNDSLSMCISDSERIPVILNRYLHSTISERADGVGGIPFRFNQNGAGNVPVEIFNFRKKVKDWSHSFGETHFERVGSFGNNSLNLFDEIYAYRDLSGQVEVSSLSSECRTRDSCSQCQGHHKTNSAREWMTVDHYKKSGKTKDMKLYVAATFNIHENSPNPLECGSEIVENGIEQLEAFLWALDQVNQNNTSIHLAGVALDSCGSPLKTSRDLADFLNLQTTRLRNGAYQNNVVALVANGRTNLVSAVMDTVNFLKIPVFAPESSGPQSNRKKYSPYPLQLSPTNSALSAAILALFGHLRWSCFSIIYLQDGFEYEDNYRFLEEYVSQPSHGLNISVKLPLSIQYSSAEVRNALRKVESLYGNGTKVVILLLPSDAIELIFRTVQAMEDEDQLTTGSLLFVTMGSEQALFTYSEQALGTIVVRPGTAKVAEFENHFRNLSLIENNQNPWFSQFWSRVFHCRGANCHNELYKNLQSYKFRASTSAANTINSVLAISHAVGTVTRELCPDGVVMGTHCAAMQDPNRIRHRLYEVAPHMAFVGAGLNSVAFSSMGENIHTSVEILNFRRDSSERYKLDTVGNVYADGNVQVDTNKMKVYVSNNRDEINIKDISTVCTSSKKSNSYISHQPMMMKVPSNKNLSILGILPVHSQGEGHFDCGELHFNSVLHAGAILYALDQVNNNASILPGVILGAVLVDSCSQASHVYGTLFNILKPPMDSPLITEPTQPREDIVAVINSDVQSADVVEPLLRKHKISQIVVSIKEQINQGIKIQNTSFWEEILKSPLVPNSILEAAKALRSHSIVIVRETSEWAETLTENIKFHPLIKDGMMCLSGVYSLYNKNVEGLVGAISSSNMMVTAEITKKLRPGTMIVLLLQDSEEIQSFLNVCHAIDGLIFMTLLQNSEKKINAGFHNVISLKPVLHTDMTEEIIDDFRQWLKYKFITYGPSALHTLPVSWINDFNGSSFEAAILKEETLNSSISSIWDTMGTVWAIANGLDRVIKRNCSYFSDADLLDTCGSDAVNIIQLIGKETLEALSSKFKLNSFTFWNGPQYIGMWEETLGFKLVNPVNFSNLLSDCTSVQCSECMEHSEVNDFQNSQPTVYHNFNYSWPSVVGGITLLGILLTVLISLYFLGISSLPKMYTSGSSSAMEYLILLGLLLLFLSNLSFILAPTVAVCGTRRIFPGFSYTIIFSAMLLKTFTTWQENASNPTESWAFCSAGLIVTAVILTAVQVVLSGVWLLLIPPQVYITTVKDNTFWQCYPAGNFQAHLLISMIYVILLLIITTVVSLVSYSSLKKKFSNETSFNETRCVLVATILTAVVFTFWGITAITAVSPQNSDLVTAVAHVVSAYILLLCLHIPKFLFCININSETSNQPTIQPVFDISNFHPTALKTLPVFNPAPPTIPDDDATNDDDLLDDPTQIIPSSLYSLEMFSPSQNSQLDDDEEHGDHCEPGTNEFTAPVNLVLGVDETISYM